MLSVKTLEGEFIQALNFKCDVLLCCNYGLARAGWVAGSGGGQGPGGIFKPYEYELMLNRGGFPVADEPSRSDRSGEPARSNKPEKKNTEKRERSLRLEDFLEGKVTNGAGCPLSWWQWASDQFKWPVERCQAVFDTFRDYWKAQPGQKGVKADWEATWRNWCRRESQFQMAEPKKGELRLRETTPAEKAEAAKRNEFLDLLRANPGKSEAEIHAMMRAA